MDLATDQAGLQPPFATAVHSFDPGIAPNTLFWTIPIPSESVDIDFDDAKAFLRDQVNHFRGRFIEDTATVKFTVEEPGFRFVSDPANTSVNEFSEIGRERNGSFFTPCA